MTTLWPKTTHVKIHEGCGGVVAWREALERPAVHFTGACQHCGADSLAQEAILPLEVGGDDDYRRTIRETPLEDRAALSWDDDADFETNQRRFKKTLEGNA